MTTHTPTRLAASLLVLGLASAPLHAATIDLGGDASFSIGAGMRLSYQSVEDAAPDGSDSSDFVVESTRVFLSGRITKVLGATLNFERSGSGNTPDGLRVMDAYVQYEPMPEFNVWFGRMLPASDRANLDGPYYLNVWDYPGVVSQYPSLAVGRDNGVQVWGKLMANKLVYAVGAFTGHNNACYAGFTDFNDPSDPMDDVINPAACASNDSDSLLYAWRVSYAIWDAEPAPAYYTGSTYYGAADIFTVALAGMYQGDGAGTSADPGDYFGINADVLLEKKLGNGGVFTFEGAYYDYDLDGKTDCGSGEPGVDPGCTVILAGRGSDDNVGGLTEGDGYLATVAYLFPTNLGIGKLQPFVRYQSFDRELSNSTVDKLDVGFNYIMKGPNAKISVFWANTEDDRGADIDQDKFVIGFQFQI